MTLFLRLVAILVLVAAAGAALAEPPPNLRQGERWLVIASRQDPADA